jgi:poly(3-hydroxybutyrate) depolymerase
MANKLTNFKWTLPRGQLLRRVLKTSPISEYLVYVPTSDTAGSPVLVSVHGISQKSWQKQAELLVPTCERHGVTLLAPGFNDQQYTDYQRLGRKGKGYRADIFLHRCLEELNTMTGADTTHVRLFGHSAGAQFVHRYLMAYPHRVECAVVSAAGWYTFPDPTLKFPYGTRTSSSLPGVSFNPEAYLKVPVTVIIGTEDTKQSEDLLSSERINEQQGITRIERARNWVAAMQAQAKAYGMPSLVNIVELIGVSHSLADISSEIPHIENMIHYSRFSGSSNESSGSLN